MLQWNFFDCHPIHKYKAQCCTEIQDMSRSVFELVEAKMFFIIKDCHYHHHNIWNIWKDCHYHLPFSSPPIRTKRTFATWSLSSWKVWKVKFTKVKLKRLQKFSFHLLGNPGWHLSELLHVNSNVLGGERLYYYDIETNQNRGERKMRRILETSTSRKKSALSSSAPLARA